MPMISSTTGNMTTSPIFAFTSATLAQLARIHAVICPGARPLAAFSGVASGYCAKPGK